jgi:hypothetical protein
MRSVTFEGEFFEHSSIFVFAGAFLDGALDIVFGHVLGAGFFNGETQTEVGIGVTAFAGGNGDFTRQAGEDGAAFGIGSTLFSFNGGPFGMSGHVVLLQMMTNFDRGMMN